MKAAESLPRKQEHDVIISGLGAETLRYIKKRRPKTTAAKVAMTFHEERQLREIFNGFDYNQSGEVLLDDFHMALEYLRSSSHFTRLGGVLDKLEESFVAMDTDGGGEVDFNEVLSLLYS